MGISKKLWYHINHGIYFGNGQNQPGMRTNQQIGEKFGLTYSAASKRVGYIFIHSKHWEQAQTWQFFPDDQKEIMAVFTESTETHSKEFTASIEVGLGLKKGIVSGQ